MDQATGKVVFKSVADVFVGAKPGDRVQVYDAHGLKRICDLTVPKSGSKKRRMSKLKPPLAKVAAFLKRTSSVRSGQGGQIRLPQFLTTIGASLRSNASNTRVVIFGKPSYRDERDKAFTFGDGFYPSDGHILASPKESIFGTAGRKKVLAAAAVDFCYLSEDHFHSELEKTQIIRFWTLYAARLGAVLTTCVAEPQTAVERALSGVTDAVTPAAIDLSDSKLLMHKAGAKRVEEKPATPPVPTTPAPVKKAPLVTKVESSPDPANRDVLFIIDGTPSMTRFFPSIRDFIRKAEAQQVKGSLRVGMVLFGEAVKTWPLRVAGKGGSLADAPELVKALSRAGPSNIESAVEHGISLFGKGRADLGEAIMFFGDVDTREEHGAVASLDQDDLKARGRIMDRLKAWGESGHRTIASQCASENAVIKKFFVDLVECYGKSAQSSTLDEVRTALSGQ